MSNPSIKQAAISCSIALALVGLLLWQVASNGVRPHLEVVTHEQR